LFSEGTGEKERERIAGWRIYQDRRVRRGKKNLEMEGREDGPRSNPPQRLLRMKAPPE